VTKDEVLEWVNEQAETQRFVGNPECATMYDAIHRLISAVPSSPPAEVWRPLPPAGEVWNLIDRLRYACGDKPCTDAQALCGEAADAITSLSALSPARLCVVCGRKVPASHDRSKPAPECPTPEACTIDMTIEEAFLHWRKVAHDRREQMMKIALDAAHAYQIAGNAEAELAARRIWDEMRRAKWPPVKITDSAAALEEAYRERDRWRAARDECERQYQEQVNDNIKLQDRVQELLEANNRYLERARTVESEAAADIKQLALVVEGYKDADAAQQKMIRQLTADLASTRAISRALTDADIKRMVERFLQWKLPNDFRPDGGITFERVGNATGPFPFRREPTGTNLFNYQQALEMVRHMIEGLKE
jgi:hypothetical protein